MSNFIFSADSHVVEPKGLYQERLPDTMKDRAFYTTKDDKYLTMYGDGRVLQRMHLKDGASGLGDQNESHKRSGGHNIDLRIEDMERDGIDAEVVFPTLGLMAWQCQGDLQAAVSRVYNDWCLEHFEGHRDRFVPCAMLPTGQPEDAAEELQRALEMGYTAAMIPLVHDQKDVPAYNNQDWDVLWQVADEHRIPINLHAGTGAAPVSIRGPGAAIMNYTRLGLQAMDAVTMMVSGGALERFPNLNFVTVECGASWLVGLGERLDEVYEAHYYYVQPKLNRKPSEYLYRQIKCSFQHDKACIENRGITGVEPLLWASDYPHAEGTFPYSRKVIQGLFEDVDITEEEKARILGGSAAALYKLPRAA